MVGGGRGCLSRPQPLLTSVEWKGDGGITPTALSIFHLGGAGAVQGAKGPPHRPRKIFSPPPYGQRAVGRGEGPLPPGLASVPQIPSL